MAEEEAVEEEEDVLFTGRESQGDHTRTVQEIRTD